MPQRQMVTAEAKLNSPKISWPCATTSSHETTDDAELEDGSEEGLRAKKLKLDPSPAWKTRLRKWMGTARWTYNQCVSLVKTKKIGAGDMKGFRSAVIGAHNHGGRKVRGGRKPTKRDRRNKKRPQKEKRAEKERRTAWVLETPMEVRDSAMMDVVKAHKTNLAKKKKNSSHTWELKYRSKKDRLQTIKIPGKCVKPGGLLFPSYTNKEPLHAFEEHITAEHELQIHLDRTGTFWATILRKPDTSPFDPTNKDLRVAALDPGVRTFNTVYDGQGTVTEMAPKDVGRIYRLCANVDKLQSRMAAPEVRSKKRCRMRKAWLRAMQRIRFLVQDVHHKCTKFLCDNYDVVFIPTFNSKSMVERSRGFRRINSKTARAMMTWSHYKFRQMLIAKAEETGTKVVAVTEEYTTKTCGACGHVREKFSGKHFRCPGCGFECDRDINGARNVLIKSIVVHNLTIGAL